MQMKQKPLHKQLSFVMGLLYIGILVFLASFHEHPYTFHEHKKQDLGKHIQLKIADDACLYCHFMHHFHTEIPHVFLLKISHSFIEVQNIIAFHKGRLQKLVIYGSLRGPPFF